MRMSEALDHNMRGRGARSAKKELSHISIRKAENGGHIVEHHFESGQGAYHEPEQHVFAAGEGKKLAAHLKEHMGINLGEEKHEPKESAKEEATEQGEGGESAYE